MNVRNQHRRVIRSGGIVRHGPVRVLGLVLAITLLTALIVPLAGSPVGAQAAGTNPAGTGQTALQDGATGEGGDAEDVPVVEETPVAEETPVVEDPPVVEETPVADENPVVQETPDAGLDSLAADPYYGRIVVTIRTCSDTYEDNFQQLDANCKGSLAGHTFDVYGVDNYGQGMQQTGTKYLDVSGLGAGNYTIRSFTPNDYRSPTVFCSRGTYPNPQGPMVETVTYDGYYEFSLVPGERLACNWFYTPRVVGYGALTLGFSVCPPVASIPIPGFDYATASVSQLATVCSLYKEQPVPFFIFSHANGFSMTMHTNAATGVATWTTLAAGGQSVSTEPWSSYGAPRVFCYVSNDPANILEATVQDWKAELNVKKSLTTFCDWFNIPAKPLAPHINGTVAVTAHVCADLADDFDPYTANHDELSAACPAYTDPFLGYDLSHAGTGETETRMTGATGDGAALWTEVIGGDLTVTATNTAGYGAPVVYCSTYNPAALVFETNYLAVSATNHRIAYELIDGFSLSCDWFAIPGPEEEEISDQEDGEDSGDEDGGIVNDEDGDVTDVNTGSVTVIAYACPKETDGQGDYAKYEAACTAAREGAIYKLDGESSGNPGEQTTGTDGSAAWSDREADHYYLYEQELPAGYGAPAVFCDTYLALDGLVPDYAGYGVSADGRIEFDLAEGESITCRWFGIPGGQGPSEDTTEDLDQDQDQDDEDAGVPTTTREAGSITIYEWLCPAGFDMASSDASPWLECTVATEGAELAIAGPDGFAAEQSAGDSLPGGVRWDGLAGGDYLIDDTQPDEAASGFVLACHGLAVPAAYPLYSTESGEPLAISLESGQHVACLWFNVPA